MRIISAEKEGYYEASTISSKFNMNPTFGKWPTNFLDTFGVKNPSNKPETKKKEIPK
jgi:hypothetical protein